MGGILPGPVTGLVSRSYIQSNFGDVDAVLTYNRSFAELTYRLVDSLSNRQSLVVLGTLLHEVGTHIRYTATD